ncbi:MAG: glycosyltransferase family 4 protein [Gammaproteobacteria bacterium]|jgi:glycosyltransferase involved in cell wall biosynthesis
MKKKVFIIVNHPKNILVFRSQLILDFKNNGYEVVICSINDSKSVFELKKRNIRFIPIRMQSSGISPIKDIIALVDLYKQIKKESPDIVVNFTIKPNIYGSIAAHFAGVKNIYSFMTGLGYVFTGHGIKRSIVRFFTKFLYKQAFVCNRKVFFENIDDLNIFINNKLIDQHKAILLNGCGVDIDRFRLVDLPDRFCFLLIARLLKDKGVVEYVQAARIIKKKYPQVSFKLIGGWTGKDNPSAIKEKIVAGWRQEGVVDFLPVVDDVRPVINSASIYVLPSYREGTSKAVLEAMAMGRPIITTDVPGCRQTIQHGKNGYLVPARNVKELALAMEKFILQPNLMKKMGAVSRKIVEEKYDVRKVNGVILDVLNEF